MSYSSDSICSFTGVLLVSLSDSKAPAGSTTRPGIIHTHIMDSRASFGDFLALTSALFYAMYVILLKVRIKSESRIDMMLFFGFVGLFNILICWPIGVFLNFTKIEVFQLPPNWIVWKAILINVGHITSLVMQDNKFFTRWPSLFLAIIYMFWLC